LSLDLDLIFDLWTSICVLGRLARPGDDPLSHP
jgi:hypothetical protein